MKPLSVAMNADSGEKTWLTPPHIVESLGPFDLDPCCPPNMPWRTAAQMICRPDDGLAVDWTGKRVWLNPPYESDAIPFLRKMVENRQQGGYFARFRAHRHICMARLDISIRIRHTFSSRPPAFLPTRRNARRDGYGALCARRVLGAGFGLPMQQRSCRDVFAHMETMTYERDYRPTQRRLHEVHG